MVGRDVAIGWGMAVTQPDGEPDDKLPLSSSFRSYFSTFYFELLENLVGSEVAACQMTQWGVDFVLVMILHASHPTEKDMKCARCTVCSECTQESSWWVPVPPASARCPWPGELCSPAHSPGEKQLLGRGLGPGPESACLLSWPHFLICCGTSSRPLGWLFPLLIPLHQVWRSRIERIPFRHQADCPSVLSALSVLAEAVLVSATVYVNQSQPSPSKKLLLYVSSTLSFSLWFLEDHCPWFINPLG